MNLLRKRRRRFHQQGKWWWLFFGIVTKLFLTICVISWQAEEVNFKKKTTSFEEEVSAFSLAIALSITHELQIGWPFNVFTKDPCDFFFFLNTRVSLDGTRFWSNDKIIAYVNDYYVEKDAIYYLECLKRLRKSLEKVYRAERILCWGINYICQKKYEFLC